MTKRLDSSQTIKPFWLRKGRIAMRIQQLLEERNFLTPRELSEVFDHQVSVTTINVLIKEGKIPHTKLGRKNLIPASFAREQLNKGLPD